MSNSTLDRRGDRRPPIIATAAGLGLLAAIVLWAASDRGAVSPRTVEGWAMPNAAGTAVSLHDSPTADAPGEGYIVAGATWTGVDNTWHDGADIPTCVGTDTDSFTHVKLGLVRCPMVVRGLRSHGSSVWSSHERDSLAVTGAIPDLWESAPSERAQISRTFLHLWRTPLVPR